MSETREVHVMFIVPFVKKPSHEPRWKDPSIRTVTRLASLSSLPRHIWSSPFVVLKLKDGKGRVVGGRSARNSRSSPNGCRRSPLVRLDRWTASRPSPLTRIRVEKYRPVFLDDVVGNTETIERLKIIAKDGNMPHVIISGMPGIGKTTSVLCLARQLLGDAYKEAVLELNASDERGRATRLRTWRPLGNESC